MKILGAGLRNPLKIGTSFVGLIDDIKISNTILPLLLTRYPHHKGTIATKVIDLGKLNRKIKDLDILTTLPSDSKVFYYYRMAPIPFNPQTINQSNITEWIKFNPEIDLEELSLLRYIQFMIELLPDSSLSESPIIHEIQIEIE